MMHNAKGLFWGIIIVLIIAIDIIGSAYFETGKTYMIFACLLVAFFIKGKSLTVNNNAKYPLILVLSFICLVIMQNMFIIGVDKGRQIVFFLYTLMLLFYARKGNVNEIHILSFCIKLLAIIGTISVLFITGFRNDVAYREDALIDKGMLTIWYAMLYAITISDILLKKNILINVFLFVFIFTINLFVVQSKTAAFSACVFVIVVYFLSEKSVRLQFRKWVLPIVFILAIAIIFFPDILLPDSMKIAINYVLGSDVLQVDYRSKQFVTFDMRSEINSFTFSLFLQNPWIGIGCGVYQNIALLGVSECENTYADIFVEGGILWGIPMCAIMIFILFKSIINIKRKCWVYENYICLAIIVSMLVVFQYNDFIRPFTFIYLGCCYYVVNSSHTKISMSSNVYKRKI